MRPNFGPSEQKKIPDPSTNSVKVNIGLIVGNEHVQYNLWDYVT